jgi:hypothetical protein
VKVKGSREGKGSFLATAFLPGCERRDFGLSFRMQTRRRRGNSSFKIQFHHKMRKRLLLLLVVVRDEG